MIYIRRWATSTVVLGSFLVLANKYYFDPRRFCNDCGIIWGFPFHFQRTETFGTSPQTLWPGLAADLIVVLIVALVATSAWSVVIRRPRAVQMRTSLRSLVLVMLLVIAATAAFYVTYGNSILRWVFLFPLLPGAVTGLYLIGHGVITLIALIVSLAVNTGLYWLIWLVVLLVIRRFRKTDSQ